MAFWAAAQLHGQHERLALHFLGLAGFHTWCPRVLERRIVRGASRVGRSKDSLGSMPAKPRRSVLSSFYAFSGAFRRSHCPLPTSSRKRAKQSCVPSQTDFSPRHSRNSPKADDRPTT